MTLTPNNLNLALLSAAILGVHHGFDYDHIADHRHHQRSNEPLAGHEVSGLLYALGHAAMVALLGSTVILFSSPCLTG